MVMAKGVEDCAFYRWSRLTSLNEVGGDPRVFAVDAGEFHDAMAAAAARLAARDDRAVDPRHQARRGRPRPDHRARRGPRRLGARRSTGCSTLVPLPDPGFGNLLWQAVVGAWPARARRARLHALRREGDARGRRPHHRGPTPDEAYEAAVHAAVDAAFDDAEVRAGPRRAASAASPAPGWSNALAAKLLALTMPGVPDVYQGSELWEQSLVDPDNRRPVDFDARARAARRAASRRAPAADRRPSTTGRGQAAASPAPRCALRRDQPELFDGYAAAGRRRARPPTTCWPSTAAARSPSSPGCRVGLAAPRRLGRHDARRCPPGAGATLLTGRVCDRPTGCRSPSCSADLPGRAAGPRATRSTTAAAASTSGRRAPSRLSAAGRRRASSPMARGDDDWWTPDRPGARRARSTTATWSTTPTTPLPDPRSRRQPDGVHERSRTFDPAAPRVDRRRAGPAASSPASVIYELHVGTFTPEGTLDAALGRLDHLRVDRRRPRRADAGQRVQRHPQLGLRRRRSGSPCTSSTAARRPTSASSTRCHAAGLGVIQDVVYNHLGPSGNYLPVFGPYLKSRARTPWGDLVNLDGEGSDEVRALHPRQRADVARATTTSTGCGSTPCTRSRRARRRTCSRRWRSRWPRCRPTCAGR